MRYQQEAFFRPDEVHRETVTLPEELHRRLVNEFPKALERLEEKHRQQGCKLRGVTVLPFFRS